VAELRALFRSGTQTQFIAVASPTPLAVAETRRLVAALADQGVAVNHLVINKVLGGGGGGSAGAAGNAAVDGAVMATMRRGQAAALERATAAGSPLASVPGGLAVTQVPLFDADVRGVAGLRYMAAVAFAGKYEVADLRPWGQTTPEARAAEAAARAAAWATLTAPADDPRSRSSGSGGQRFVVVGGKGGVGKTSTSAALAVACCETGGYNTVVVSTVLINKKKLAKYTFMCCLSVLSIIHGVA
jgi:arsenite-transporting ATPase